MSLKINLVRINNDGTVTDPYKNPSEMPQNDPRQFNNILKDVFQASAYYENDTIEPFPSIGTYEDKYYWIFTYLNGTNVETCIVNNFEGKRTPNFVFYKEGLNTISLKLIKVNINDPTDIIDYGIVDYIDINLYEIGDTIYGPEYVKLNSENVLFYVKDGAEKYEWNTGSTNSSISLNFYDLKSDNLSCTITHGQQSTILKLTVKTVIGPIVENDYVRTDVTPNLMFFNNKGDNLNFDFVEYEPNLYRWEGDLLFEENSNDTFKTLNLYTLEKVAPITMTNVDELEVSTSGNSLLQYNKLNLIKYQLFNEFGIDFHRSRETKLKILNISASINAEGFYSKWIYGDNFHLKFRVGSEIWVENVNFKNGTPPDFNLKKPGMTTTYEFQTLTVIDSKMDAILVITETENINWNYEYDIENYGLIYSSNFIRVINPDYLDKQWNESNFRNLGLNGLYDKKKLTIVNSQKNDGVYTVNFRENNTNLPYKEKYLKTNILNRKDLKPGYGFEIILNFLANRILLSNTVVDFIPKSITNLFLNRKNLILYEWSFNRDSTPTLLQEGIQFTFEQDGINQNFNWIYTVIKKDKAINILEPNDSDRKGYTLETIDVISCLTDPPTIRIENFDSKTNENKIFDVDITKNKIFMSYVDIYLQTKQTTLTLEYLTNLVQIEINNQAKGINTLWNKDDTKIIILETLGWKLLNVQVISNQNKNGIIVTLNNPPTNNLPTNGIIGGVETELNENTIGYIYHRTSTNTFHIQVDYDIENLLPIWYTIHELQTVIWVDSSGTVEYQQNVQRAAYLTSTEITFKQEWINKELLTAISLLDLDQLEQTNPDAKIFTDIANEQYLMFNNFIVKWQSTFDHYGLNLYLQTDTNVWDCDIEYKVNDYTKFNGIFYKCLVNNIDKQPDEYIGTYWKELDELILLCVERKYLLNSNDNNNPIIENDYMQVDFNGINTFIINTNETSGFIEPLNSSIRYNNVYQIEVLEQLNDEYNHLVGIHKNEKSISKRHIKKVIINDIDKIYGLNIIINGIEFNVNFDNIVTDYDDILNNAYDIQETLFDWGNRLFGVEQDTFSPNDHTDIGLKYYQKLESLGIITYLERSGQYDDYFGTAGLAPYDTIVMVSKYPNVNFTFEIQGTNNRHLIYHSKINFYEIGNILTITINGYTMSVETASIEYTLNLWIETWQLDLEQQHIFVKYNFDNNIHSLIFYTLYDTTKLVYTIWVGITPKPTKRLYDIIDLKPGNEGIIIAGNEVLNLIPYADFQKYNFATGMILSIDGSKWPLNNQEYNILLVDPRNLGLSYQGPFWNSFDLFGEGFDDIDTDPDRVGNQPFDWEQYADTLVKFEVTDFLKINRVDDLNNDASYYQIEFTDVTNVDNDEIAYWEWSFGDDSDKKIITNTNTNYENSTSGIILCGTDATSGTCGYAYVEDIRKVQHIFESTGSYIVSLLIKFTNDTYQKITSVYTITEDYIHERGPQTFDDIILKTREFLRYPREGYDNEPNTYLKWKLIEIDEDISPTNEMFLYDVSGTQLKDEGIYTYIGPKPLFANNDIVYLNDKPNKNLDYIEIPKYQQTIFKEINFELKRIDSEIDITYETEPMQTLVGYKNDDEEVSKKILILEKYNPLTISIKTEKIESNNTDKNLPIDAYKNVVYFIEELNEIRVDRFDTTFIELGIKKDMKFKINGFDNTNTLGQVTFTNSGRIVRVKNFGTNWIKLTDDSHIVNEISWKKSKETVAPYNTISVSFTLELITVPIEIGRFNVIGQTEIEDERFKIMMYNLGLNIQPRHTYIFKKYNIKEAGIDWIYLNNKRKELLFNFPEIYNYVGSYKAVINAINYFGYNDLEFNEYYRNVDENSINYGKLEKLRIHDMLNNLVAGYKLDDQILKFMPSKRYIKTNLFNLTYNITDEKGNNIIAYSVNEVTTKLLGLKQWLNEEMIPIGRRIIDITGHSSNMKSFNYSHDQKNVINLKLSQTISPVDFKIEAYLQPILNESSTYNIHIDFFVNDSIIPSYFTLHIMTFSDDNYKDYTSFDMHAVQVIKEYRTNLDSYNFTADMNIDPYILVEVTTDNGYGLIYKQKRTYSLKIFDFSE